MFFAIVLALLFCFINNSKSQSNPFNLPPENITCASPWILGEGSEGVEPFSGLLNCPPENSYARPAPLDVTGTKVDCGSKYKFNCTGCILDPDCDGWCGKTTGNGLDVGVCLDKGLALLSCGTTLNVLGGSMVTSSDQCPALVEHECSTKYKDDCAGCLADAACGYCWDPRFQAENSVGRTGTCYPVGFDAMCNPFAVEWLTAGDKCPCETMDNCTSCVDRSDCGFCSAGGLGKCVAVDEPLNGTAVAHPQVRSGDCPLFVEQGIRVPQPPKPNAGGVDFCPDAGSNVCCTADMTDFVESFLYKATLIVGNETGWIANPDKLSTEPYLDVSGNCFANFRHLMCAAVCSSEQTTSYALSESTKGPRVEKVSFFVDAAWANGFWNSCKNRCAPTLARTWSQSLVDAKEFLEKTWTTKADLTYPHNRTYPEIFFTTGVSPLGGSLLAGKTALAACGGDNWDCSGSAPSSFLPDCSNQVAYPGGDLSPSEKNQQEQQQTTSTTSSGSVSVSLSHIPLLFLIIFISITITVT